MSAVSIYLSSETWTKKKEAFYMFSNLICCCQDSKLVRELLSHNDYHLIQMMIQVLCHYNTSNDPNMVLAILDAIETGFHHDKFTNVRFDNQLVVKFEELRGIEVLEELQKHPN